MHVRDAVSAFCQQKGEEAKPATLKDYRKCLRPLLAKLDKDLAEVTPEDVQALYHDLKYRPARYVNHPSRPLVRGGLRVHTLHKFVRVWKTFFNWCVVEGLVPLSPARKLKRPKLPKLAPKGVPPCDVLRLLKQAQRSGLLREEAIVCTLAGTACRLGGLTNATPDDIDWETGAITLTEKGDKSRTVRLPPRALKTLRRYIDEERPRGQGSTIFIGVRGPLTESGVYLALKRLARSANVTRFNPHAFRHGFVNDALKNGMNVKAIQEILGHEDVTTTLMIYGAMAQKDVLEAHDKSTYLPDEDDDWREPAVEGDGCVQLRMDL